MKINKSVEQYIYEKINAGEWKPNYKLPTEEKLIETLSVSKMTVRKAIDSLKHQEVLYSIQGKGVYVSPFFESYKFVTLAEKLGATHIETLPSNSKMPEQILTMFSNDIKFDLDNIDSFVRLYFIKSEIVAYSINWINYKVINSVPSKVFQGKQLFTDKRFSKVISINKMEITTSTDKNLLLLDAQWIPTTYSYYIMSDRKIALTRIIKTKPKYFTSYDFKTRQ